MQISLFAPLSFVFLTESMEGKCATMRAPGLISPKGESWTKSLSRIEIRDQGQAPESRTSWACKDLDSPVKPGNDGIGKTRVVKERIEEI
jgi:hypothetical protein